jgi:ribosome-associated protein
MARYDSSAMQEEIVSKSQVKRDMAELRALGVSLLELPQAQVDALELPEALAGALREARRITSHAARKRQVQYIGKLMREVDPTPIRAALNAVAGRSGAARARQRRLEQWRERLIADDAALTEFAAEHPGIDLQSLRALIRNARKEIAGARPPRAQRELFRMVREATGES